MITPETKDQISNIGCLVVTPTTGILLYLSFQVHWTYACAAFAIFTLWIVISSTNAKAERQSLRDLLAKSGDPVPELKFGGHYGFPTFTLIFPTIADLEAAEKSVRFQPFKAEIQKRHAHIAHLHNPFDADRAVILTYKGSYLC